MFWEGVENDGAGDAVSWTRFPLCGGALRDRAL